MALELIKDEVLQEMEAIKHFVDLAIHAQKAGYTKAAAFFLAEAREDCEHSFLYARELDKHDEVVGDMTIVEIVQKYQELEQGAVKRILAIKEQLVTENCNSLTPFILEMLHDHSEEAYSAKKLLQKVSILASQDAVNDIEDLFEELSDKSSDDNEPVDI